MTTNGTTPDTNQPIGIKIGGVFAASTASLKAVGHVVREVTVLVHAITEHTRAETELAQARTEERTVAAQAAGAAHQRDAEKQHVFLSILDLAAASGLEGMFSGGSGREGSFGMGSGRSTRGGMFDG